MTSVTDRGPRGMTYFFGRLFLVALPLLVWQVVELFFLPPNFFTFRPWEALTAKCLGLFTGPLYPDRDLSMMSAPDMDPRGPRLKRIRFRTDSYGYRNLSDYDASTTYDYLLVGDSNFAGVNVDEPDSLAGVLEQDFGKKVYNAAFGYPHAKAFVNDPRIAANPPRWVILDMRPQDVLHGRYSTWPGVPGGNTSLKAKLGETPTPWERFLYATTSEPVRVLYDRAAKQLGYNFLRARLGLAKARPEPLLTPEQATTNFIAVLDSLVNMRQKLRERGSDLLVLLMPVPYPIGVGDAFASRLEQYVPMVHWQATSPYADECNPDTWFEPHDSHWQESSIRKAAKRIVAKSQDR